MFDFLKQGEVTLADIEASIKELPLPEKIRALAVYKRYKQIREIEEKMNEKTKAIEKEYLKLDAPVLEKVSQIVQGQKDIEEAELKDLDKYLTKEEQEKVSEHQKAKKIPNYWLKVLSNASLVKEQIGKEDEPILKALENIRVEDEEGTDNFTIVFEFAENQFIANKQLTKKFYIKKDMPVKCESCKIEFKGKDIRFKQIKKKQKNKKTGQQRVVTKTVENKSFFNFFRDVEAEEINELEANEEQLKNREKLDDDFEVGGVLVDEVLPYSLEYFLGIEHEGDEDDEDLEDGDDDDEDDDDEKKDSKSKSKSKSKGKGKKGKGDKPAQKPECNQQ